MSDDRQFESFTASELFCPRCRRSQPVRERLLLVLPTGNKYEYRCAECNASVGEREDGDSSAFRDLNNARRSNPERGRH